MTGYRVIFQFCRDALDNLESKMEEMERNNISNAHIVMGDVIGLIHIQDKNTETRDTCYSSDLNRINVTDCQSDLQTDILWSVKIPSEAFNKSRLENHGSALLGILRFKNMGKDETKNYTVLNNEVYGITMRANISDLTNNIEMFFKQKDLVGEASCSSWDGKGNLTWTTSGCKTEKINNNTIKCSCSHLAFFTVLMISPPDVNPNITASYVESLSFISYIGCGISMFFLSIALFLHFLRDERSNQATKILMNMFVALFLLNLSFLSNESVANTGDKAACVFIALLMHYSMLTTFTWFFIQALHMYLWLIRQNITITNYMRKITVFGWTFPAPIIVAVVSLGEYKAVIMATSGKTTRMCWITDPLIHYIVNIGYYALVFIFTTGIFIMIVTKIFQTRHIRAPEGKRKTFRKQLMMVLSLFLLFGLTWAVAFFSYGEMLIPSYYIFTVLNSFQGLFLFLYYHHIHNDVAGYFSDDPESSSSTTTIISQSQPDENKTAACWITDPLIHYIEHCLNIGYYALVFIFTTGIFIMIINKIVQARHIKAADGKRKTFRKQLMMVLSLFLLFGLTWAVAFFSYGEMLIPSYYIFTVLNSFQGEKQSHGSDRDDCV
ncbi:unnamed protein product [Leuciscus chuanchicus]